MYLPTSGILPDFAKLAARPGCGKSAISGGLPPSTRVEIVASNSLVPSYWMSMPVLSSNSFTASLNLLASSPVKGPVMLTLVPLSLPANASASSWLTLAAFASNAGSVLLPAAAGAAVASAIAVGASAAEAAVGSAIAVG